MADHGYVTPELFFKNAIRALVLDMGHHIDETDMLKEEAVNSTSDS